MGQDEIPASSVTAIQKCEHQLWHPGLPQIEKETNHCNSPSKPGEKTDELHQKDQSCLEFVF
jgi:hypothetical protein